MNQETIEFGLKVWNHGINSNGTLEDFEELLKLFNIEVNLNIEEDVLKFIENTKLPYQKINKIYKLPLWKYIVFLKEGTFIVYEFIPYLTSSKIIGSWFYAELIKNIFLPYIFNEYEISIIIKEFFKRKKEAKQLK